MAQVFMQVFRQGPRQSVSLPDRPLITQRKTSSSSSSWNTYHPTKGATRSVCDAACRDVQIDQSPIERLALLYQLLFLKKFLERELGLAQNQLQIDARCGVHAPPLRDHVNAYGQKSHRDDTQ